MYCYRNNGSESGEGILTGMLLQLAVETDGESIFLLKASSQIAM
jgi:hypothetical protein